MRWRGLTAVAAMALLAACADATITGSPTGSASGSPSDAPSATHTGATGGLAFVRPVGGVSQLFVLRPDADPVQLTSLTDDRGGMHVPMWSPDRSRIAFGIGQPPLVTSVVNADGTDARRISDAGILIDWSPDGRSVLIGEYFEISSPDFVPRHWIVDVESGTAEEVDLPPVRSWLADGTFLAIRHAATNVFEAYRFDPRTGGETFLLPADEVEWSPDGARLVYSRHVPCISGPCVELGLADADGANAQPVAAGMMPAWSPDGSKIAYLETIDRGPHSRLKVITATGEPVEVRDLTAQFFAWAPDSSALAVVTGDVTLGEQRLVILSLGGGELIDLGEGSFPAWAP